MQEFADMQKSKKQQHNLFCIWLSLSKLQVAQRILFICEGQKATSTRNWFRNWQMKENIFM